MEKINGAVIRKIREAKELTQLYVATYVGVTTDTVSRWENQHYQTIKRENAVKLAEALEVPLEEILLGSESGGEPTDVSRARQPLSIFQRRMALLLAFFVVFFMSALVIFYWKHDDRQSVFIHARRIIPNHTPLQEPFPVVVVIETEGEQISLIVTEKMPKGVTSIKAVPKFQSVDPEKGLIRWIKSSNGKTMRFSYLAKIDADKPHTAKFVFSGAILARKVKPTQVDVSGNDTIEIAPFHWADKNKDNRIDDEEILSAYELFNSFQGLDEVRNQIEEIWAGSGYRWHAGNKQYVITKP